MPDRSSQPRLHLVIPSTPLAVRDALDRVTAMSRQIGLCEDQVAEIRITLGEILNNVVEHAFPELEKPGEIDVRCDIRENNLHLQISDDGVAMPNHKLPDGGPVKLECDFEDLPEGGFGWFLIRELAEDLQYERRDGRNILRLRFPVPPAVSDPDQH